MAVESNLDISPEQRKTLIALLNRYIPNTTVWAFGSRAKWQARANSDLDLVAFATPSQAASISVLKEALEESNLPFKVDLLVWNNIPKSFQENIESHYVILLKAHAEQASIHSKELNPIIDIVDFNPKRDLQRGEEAKYIDMSTLPTDGRDIHEISKRIFSGSGSKFKNGDTLFSRITPCLENGKTAKVSCLEQGEVAAGSTEFIVLAPKKETDEDFVYYLARLPEFRAYAISRMEGTSGRQRVSWQALSEFKLSFPEAEARRKIGLQLKTIDDKIELNNQINQTLEAMAQAIFKSWFVDFEPVKAKMSVLQTGGSQAEVELAAMMAISGKTAEQLSAMQTTQAQAYQQLTQTAALFPSAMQDSELGEIPEGWEVKGLDSIANHLNGLALQKFRPKDGEASLPVLKISQLKAGVADGDEKASANINSDYVVENGDVVFSWSGSLVVDIWCGGKAALNQHLFKVTSDEYPKWFYYFFTKHHLGEFQRIAAAKAVTMGHIKREHLTSALCAVNKTAIETCSKILSGLLDQQITLRIENRQLSELRDSLLPKLLSGEIDLSAIDEVAA